MDDYAIRETADGVAVLGEKLTHRTLGGGHAAWLGAGCARATGVEFPKSLTWRLVELPPAHMERC